MKTTAQHKTARAEQYRADSELALSAEAASRYMPQHKTARAEQIYNTEQTPRLPFQRKQRPDILA